MKLLWLKNKVTNLITKYQSNNPFELCSQLNINVIEWDLHQEINGYYKYDRRNKYIVINQKLDDEWKKTVCAHELGHAILHTRLNTPFMQQNTLFSVDKVEREANRFAAELLIPDESFRELNNIYEIASLHNVPVELVQLKREKLF
ncbi:ImmA/IrrE family metallo-endopeptidase [Lysinibacillus composti]|uniref:ImmA/IrrE family metallo-endopeptidase n=1 Tax=Lysinibacillus composti TaxID=720633 RepID=A0A3N9UVU0_9BACI|nr:ImmA/IrrE family metallo-endopeptidase [Lysinibacillus composti]RQW75976.1 ImmA/IrrE family metallo-endopeptidase [Lysinibacillus composti]